MVGSHVAEFYAREGAQVTVFDNLGRSRMFGSGRASVEHNWRLLKGMKRVRCVRGDVRSLKSLLAVVPKGVDAVIHAASQPGVRYSLENPLSDFEINAAGTVNVLEAVRRRSPRAAFIYCSTNKVYGENVGTIPLEELERRYRFPGSRAVDVTLSTDHTLHTPYGASKLAGDLYVQEYGKTYGLRTGVFRMSCIYGPRQFGFEDQGWLAHFAFRALKRLPITVYGDGKQVRDCLYIDDLVKAYAAFIRGGASSDVFNIGGGERFTLSLLELIAVLEEELKTRSRVVFRAWRPADQKVYISDLSHVQKALQWKPEVPPREGIRRLLMWAKEHVRLLP